MKQCTFCDNYDEYLANKPMHKVLLCTVFALVAFAIGLSIGHFTYSQRVRDAQAQSAQLQFDLDNNPRVIPFEYDDCEAMFLDFYSAYPNYHYEDEEGNISIDYVVPNPQEEAAQYCTFIIDSFSRAHTLAD